jgi:hypothetical protein
LGRLSISRFESLLLLNVHTANRAVSNIGESRNDRIQFLQLFYRRPVEKPRSFLIDVVVPRKIRKVYGLLVIGNGALKLHLVTSFQPHLVT